MTWRRDPPRPEECPSWWWFRGQVAWDGDFDEDFEPKGAIIVRANYYLDAVEIQLAGDEVPQRLQNMHGEWSGPIRPPEE